MTETAPEPTDPTTPPADGDDLDATPDENPPPPPEDGPQDPEATDDAPPAG